MTVFEIGDPIEVSKVREWERESKDRLYRSRSVRGRRISSLSSVRGRYYRYRYPAGEGVIRDRDIALDATIRAAASHQRHNGCKCKRSSESRSGSASTSARGGERELAIEIKASDIREKIRVCKVSTATMFVVDASGSMGAERRMASAKGAVFSLLMDAYQQRDKVGMVAFRGTRADVLLPLCASVDLAYKSLEELPTGGRTPLAAGLELGINTLIAERARNEDVIPVLVLISDGRANVSAGAGAGGGGGGGEASEHGATEIRDELLAVAEYARAKGVYTIVIDTEVVSNSFIHMQLGYCREIAAYSGGRYYPIADLTPGKVQEVVSKELEGRRTLNPSPGAR